MPTRAGSRINWIDPSAIAEFPNRGLRDLDRERWDKAEHISIRLEEDGQYVVMREGCLPLGKGSSITAALFDAQYRSIGLSLHDFSWTWMRECPICHQGVIAFYRRMPNSWTEYKRCNNCGLEEPY